MAVRATFRSWFPCRFLWPLSSQTETLRNFPPKIASRNHHELQNVWSGDQVQQRTPSFSAVKSHVAQFVPEKIISRHSSRENYPLLVDLIGNSTGSDVAREQWPTAPVPVVRGRR
ncbi:uncharacterized protein LOC129739227 [Uranotaenia lowii]|uniref:uncharacterized protein LOC129739227 n=1 Tax=Uranotaenia lowii TaxID=190385 RepID=UPI002479BC60|nr:uncharacterized protein LOC129739227 [Uranotaenia lowii]